MLEGEQREGGGVRAGGELDLHVRAAEGGGEGAVEGGGAAGDGGEGGGDFGEGGGGDGEGG